MLSAVDARPQPRLSGSPPSPTGADQLRWSLAAPRYQLIRFCRTSYRSSRARGIAAPSSCQPRAHAACYNLILGETASPHRSAPSDGLTYERHDLRGAGAPRAGGDPEVLPISVGRQTRLVTFRDLHRLRGADAEPRQRHRAAAFASVRQQIEQFSPRWLLRSSGTHSIGYHWSVLRRHLFP